MCMLTWLRTGVIVQLAVVKHYDYIQPPPSEQGRLLKASQETAEAVEKWRETERQLKIDDQAEELRSRERINEIKDAATCDAEGWARRNNDLRDEIYICKARRKERNDRQKQRTRRDDGR